MNIVERVKSPTPVFFKVLRAIGISLALAGGTIMASPALVPAVIPLASYALLAGTVMSAVSQTAVETTKKTTAKKKKAAVKKSKADEPATQQ
jgi:hypothetical protein